VAAEGEALVMEPSELWRHAWSEPDINGFMTCRRCQMARQFGSEAVMPDCTPPFRLEVPPLAEPAPECNATREHDPVERPRHYTQGKIQPIEAIEDWRLGFHLGQVIKYVARAEHKGSKLEDLKKAKWYLERAIARAERGES
jgi:hypothetical protein